VQTPKNSHEIESINSAIRSGEVETLRKLLSSGCRVNPEWEISDFVLYDDRVGYYHRFASAEDFPLWFAISEEGHTRIVEDDDAENLGDLEPLYDAKTKAEIITLLLDYGARTAPFRPDLEQTALTFAIENENAEAVEVLLAHGKCNPNEADPQSRIPLHLAIERSSWRIVQVLLKFGADTNKMDESGTSGYKKILSQMRNLKHGPSQAGITWDESSSDPDLRGVFQMIQHGAGPRWEDEDFRAIAPKLISLACDYDVETLFRLAKPFCRGSQFARSDFIQPQLDDKTREALLKKFHEGFENAFWANKPDTALICCLCLLESLHLSYWLFLAADQGKPEFVMLLLRLGADPRAKFQIKEPFKDLNGKIHSGVCRPSQIARSRLKSAKSFDTRDLYIRCEELLLEFENRQQSWMNRGIARLWG
jgi:hypothetical protein